MDIPSDLPSLHALLAARTEQLELLEHGIIAAPPGGALPRRAAAARGVSVGVQASLLPQLETGVLAALAAGDAGAVSRGVAASSGAEPAVALPQRPQAFAKNVVLHTFALPDSDAAVSCLEWSPTSSEQLVVGYGGGWGSTDDATPALALWSSARGAGGGSAPLCVLRRAAWSVRGSGGGLGAWLGSGVTSVAFVPECGGQTVVAGASCGALLLWDLRAPDGPAASSRACAAAHSNPVLSLRVGAASGGGGGALTSVSSDGRVCEWDLGRGLAGPPARAYDLQRGGGSLRPASLSSPPGDPQLWFVGGEDGSLSWGAVGSDSGSGGPGGSLAMWAAPDGSSAHLSAISALAAHPHPDAELLLSASLEGCVRLWSTRARRLAPLHELDASPSTAGAVLTDAAWSPTAPAVCAAVDSGAQLRVWQLEKDDRAPLLLRTVAPLPDAPRAGASGQPAGLTRLRWSPDGRHLALGDVAGMTHLIALGDDLVGRGAGGEEEEVAALRTRALEWAEMDD